jgi:hypothetical protein
VLSVYTLAFISWGYFKTSILRILRKRFLSVAIEELILNSKKQHLSEIPELIFNQAKICGRVKCAEHCVKHANSM